MNLRRALYIISHILARGGIDNARIEAEILLCYALGISKTQLYSEPEQLLSSAAIDYLWHCVRRRLLHEPIAYISNHCNFYNIDLYVDGRVLIPRPETELLVEEALEFASYSRCSRGKFVIADIGTGSGAIAISLSLALPQAKIYATDISSLALQVADINCQRYQVNEQVTLLHGDLLEPLPEPADVIVANLPYIKNSELRALSPEIRNFEPAIALDGGVDGLDKIRSLLDQTPGKIHPQGCLLLEIGQGQGGMVKSSICDRFPKTMIQLVPDLGGLERVLKITI